MGSQKTKKRFWKKPKYPLFEKLSFLDEKSGLFRRSNSKVKKSNDFFGSEMLEIEISTLHKKICQKLSKKCRF